ncbi:MAG: c-type cytochrome [Bacteroidota bacterium]
MKHYLSAATCFALLLCLANCTEQTSSPKQAQTAENKTVDHDAMIKRGQYMVIAGGCNDCHSPKIMTPAGPEPDPQRLLSGHPAGDALPPITDKHITAPGQWVLFSPGLTAAVGPWGTTFASNLTPDDTGIGAWTESQFLKAIREGKSKGLDGTRPLLPPMPWMNIAKMTDEDLKAIFAYLKSLPPVKNAVPNPIAAGM